MTKYLVFLVRHKWYVLLAGISIGVNMSQLIAHDMGKLKPRFVKGYTSGDITASIAAHHATARHHPEYWGHCAMPDKYVMEMVADWLGYERAAHGTWDITDWLQGGAGGAIDMIHAESRRTLLQVLSELGYKLEYTKVLGQ